MIDWLVNWFGNNIITIVTIIGGAIAWLYERTKRKEDLATLQQENQKLRTENDSSIVSLYQNALNDLKTRYDEKFAELTKELEILKERLRVREVDYSNLKNEFNQYKQNHK